jgi:hypothetical protein
MRHLPALNAFSSPVKSSVQQQTLANLPTSPKVEYIATKLTVTLMLHSSTVRLSVGRTVHVKTSSGTHVAVDMSRCDSDDTSRGTNSAITRFLNKRAKNGILVFYFIQIDGIDRNTKGRNAPQRFDLENSIVAIARGIYPTTKTANPWMWTDFGEVPQDPHFHAQSIHSNTEDRKKV